MFASTRRHLLALTAAFPLAGCSATAALNSLVPRGTYRLHGDVAYGDDPRQRLDVYQPDGERSGAPMVVFFYGGSWTRGERADYRFVGEALASAGIVTVVADYRLSPQVHWTGILDDCARATGWAYAHAGEFGASTSRFFVMGHSAGAYNAAMLALDPRWLAQVQRKPGELAGWIGLAGPYDFLPIGDPDTQVAFDWPRTPADSQPIDHVTARAPRALLLAAKDDHTVNPVRNTLGLAQKLRAAGVAVDAELLGRVNHVTLVASLATPLRVLAPVRSKVVEFVGAAA